MAAVEVRRRETGDKSVVMHDVFVGGEKRGHYFVVGTAAWARRFKGDKAGVTLKHDSVAAAVAWLSKEVK